MTYPYKNWPAPCRNVLMLCIAACIAAVLVFLLLLQPKWRELREAKADYAANEKKLKDSPWPRDPERLQTLLSTYQRSLGSARQAGLKKLAEDSLKRAGSQFEDKINFEYGDAALFISKASQIEYKDQYDRMYSSLQNKRIYLDQYVFGMDETTVEPVKYKMLLKIWTADKLVNLALQHKLRICVDNSIRTGPHNQFYAAKISVLPEKAYVLDEDDKQPYLLEFPVRITVRCSLNDFLQFCAALQSEPDFFPMQQIEILTDVSRGGVLVDEDNNLVLNQLEITFVCSSFYQPSATGTLKPSQKSSLPTLPRGA